MTELDRFVRQHVRVAFDSNILIGLFEETDYSVQSLAFFDAVQSLDTELWTSVVTIPEVLEQPLHKGNTPIVERYRAVLHQDSLNLAPVTEQATWRSIDFIDRYRLRSRDALHLASLLEAGVQGFVTADKDFAVVQELDVLILPTRRTQRHR